jgi:sugar phosphate isomerase/epimerase
MKTNTTTRTSADIIENTLRPFDVWELNRYLQSIALPDAIAEARKDLSFSMESTLWSFNAQLGEVANDLAARADSAAGRRLASLLAIKYVIDHCPELPAIRATLDPIFEELENAKAREADQQAAKVAAQLAVQAAEEAARADLEAKLADDPQLAAARRELEELEAVLA